MPGTVGLVAAHWAGKSFVLGSGVFQNCRMACCRELVFRLPSGVVLSGIKHLAVLTPTSALQMQCGKGKATDNNNCHLTRQLLLMHTPLLEELPRSSDGVFGAVIRDAKCGKCALQALHQDIRALPCQFDNGPVQSSVHINKVIDPFVVEASLCTCIGRGMLVAQLAVALVAGFL